MTEEKIDYAAMHFALARDAEHDGHPFGLPPGAPTHGHVLRVDDDGCAILGSIYEGVEREACRCADWLWPHVAKMVESDFNERLVARGMPRGRFPEKGGKVYMLRALGKELAIAMYDGESRVLARSSLYEWPRLQPIDRLKVWRLARAEVEFGKRVKGEGWVPNGEFVRLGAI